MQMNFETIRAWLTLDNFMNLVEHYRSFGVIPGLLMTLLESFLPILPIFIFVLANTNAFGFWVGFLISWVGTVLGALLVFTLVRRFGNKRFFLFIRKNRQVKRLLEWVDRHGFGPLFLLLCFPFTPSAVVNVVAGLSKLSFVQYALAVLTGKLVMIFTISYIGHDIPALLHQPKKTIVVLIVIFLLWLAGKQIEKRMNPKIKDSKKVKTNRTRGTID